MKFEKQKRKSDRKFDFTMAINKAIHHLFCKFPSTNV